MTSTFSKRHGCDCESASACCEGLVCAVLRRYYQTAHELRHARATFNLGWCYHRGIGVKQRDLHLAKRHYGLSAEAATDAAWPTRAALALLQIERT